MGVTCAKSLQVASRFRHNKRTHTQDMNTRLILAAGAGAVGLYFGSAWYQKSRASQNTMPPAGGEHNKNKQVRAASTVSVCDVILME